MRDVAEVQPEQVYTLHEAVEWLPIAVSTLRDEVRAARWRIANGGSQHSEVHGAPPGVVGRIGALALDGGITPSTVTGAALLAYIEGRAREGKDVRAAGRPRERPHFCGAPIAHGECYRMVAGPAGLRCYQHRQTVEQRP